jgi:arylsulfatase A-like enzyme
MDDMGQRALSCYGNPLLKAPHLDGLAAEGMRFTGAYVTPQCTPTRATILTGQYTARNRMWHVIPWYGTPWGRVREPEFKENPAREQFILPKGMKAAGYTTAIFGKWRLTRNEDGNYIGLRNGASDGFDAVMKSGSSPNEPGEDDQGAVRLTSEAIAFIEANRNRPFFRYLAHYTTHPKVTARAEIVKKHRDQGATAEGLHNATYPAELEHMEGRNREFSNEPLRAGKGSNYEGGVRVPLIVRWPGAVRPGGVCRTPVHGVDLMPTFFGMCGVKAPAGHVQDGVSIEPLLRGKTISPRVLFGCTPFYELNWAVTPSAQIREGNYKRIGSFGDYIDAENRYREGHRLELFHRASDTGEKNNLASRDKARAQELQKKLHEWIRWCGAEIPGPNPRYDPKRCLEQTSQRPTAQSSARGRGSGCGPPTRMTSLTGTGAPILHPGTTPGSVS